MADTVSKRKRSQVMAAVRSRGNRATELKLMALFREFGIKGWRRNQGLLGKPDFVFATRRVAIFVDGCFWHGCPKHCRMPKGNRIYWQTKIAGNIGRDALVTRTLRCEGWRVLRVWEHDLAQNNQVGLMRRIERAMQ